MLLILTLPFSDRYCLGRQIDKTTRFSGPDLDATTCGSCSHVDATTKGSCTYDDATASDSFDVRFGVITRRKDYSLS